MGRIPGFTATIFRRLEWPRSGWLPTSASSSLFLFLVGLEINLNYLLSN